MHVSRLTSLNGVGPRPAEWNRLAQGVPFRCWEWLEAWWRHYGDDAPAGGRRELFTLCVFDHAGRLVGVAPWFRDRTATGRRIVRFFGSGEVCSDYLTILCHPGREAPVAAALANWLFSRVPTMAEWLGATDQDRWDHIELAAVDPADPAIASFTTHLADHGALIHRRPSDACWRVELPGDWDEYLAMLSKSHRKQVRRVERRLFDTGRAVHHVVRDTDELKAGFDILIDLHQRRRWSLGQPGCFSSERFTAFHRDVAARLLAEGMLRLSWVELDGRPIAAEYHLAGGDVVYGYQSGVDPRALDDEPGRLAAYATLRATIDDGARAFDFLRGDEPYKAHWRAEPRPTIDLRIAPATTRARVAHGVWVAKQNIKDWVRAGMQTTATWMQPTSAS